MISVKSKSENAGRQRSAFFVAPILLGITLLVANSLSETAKAQDQSVYTAEKIKQWISQLEDDSFLVRESAKTKLKEAGALAFSQLYRARNELDLEARLTIEELISQIKIQWIGSGDSQRVIDMMIDFQTRRVEDRFAIVDRLSWYSQREAWQALYRISVYDKAEEVSSYAAGRLIQMCFSRDEQPLPDVQRSYRELSGKRYGSVDSLLKSDAAWSEKIVAVCFELGNRKQSVTNVDKLFVPAVELQNETVEEWTTSDRLSDQLRESLFLTNNVLFKLASELNDKVLAKKVLNGLDRASLQLVDKNSEASDVVYVLNDLLKHSRFEAAEKVVGYLDLAENPWHGFWQCEVKRRQQQERESIKLAEVVYKRTAGDLEFLANGIAQLTEWKLDYWSAFVLKRNESIIPIQQRLKLAELEFNAGQFQSSEDLATKVFNQTGSMLDKLQSANLLAKICNKQNRPEDEKEWLGRMLKLDPLSTTALVGMSRLAEQQIDLDREELRRKLDRAKGAYRDQFRIGSQLSQSSTPAEANLGRVKMAAAANSLAWLLFNLDEETGEASKMGNVAVQLEPRNADFLDTLAFGEFRFGSKEKAVSLQKRAVFLAPGNENMKLRLQKYRGRN